MTNNDYNKCQNLGSVTYRAVNCNHPFNHITNIFIATL